MIRIVLGNLLDAQENIIGHQVNCKGVMGAGVARQIREKWPIAYAPGYRSLCNATSGADLLGTVQIIPIGQEKFIANIFGEDGYGKSKNKTYTDYEALRRAFISLAAFAKDDNYSIALPYGLGAGYGNGNWDTIYSIIEAKLFDCDVTLYKLNT